MSGTCQHGLLLEVSMLCLYQPYCSNNSALAGMKLVLLWDTKNDDGIRLFLHEAWEAYAKV